MPSLALILSSIALIFGIIYQVVLKDIIVLFPWHTIQPISDFPYTCRRISHPLLQSCEHIWLDDETRTLYAACGHNESRRGWNPASVLRFYSTF